VEGWCPDFGKRYCYTLVPKPDFVLVGSEGAEMLCKQHTGSGGSDEGKI